MKALVRFFAPAPAAPPLQDEKQIAKLFLRKRITIFTSLTFGYAFFYTCRIALGIIKKPLIDGGIFSAEDLGQIGAATFYGYALGKCINGFISDHVNLKRFLPLGLAISACINLVMGLHPIFFLWVVLWGLNGWFQGFGAPGSVALFSAWFPPRMRGRVYGIWSTSHSLGEGMMFIVGAVLVDSLAWNAAFLTPGTLCIGVAVLMYLALEDRPPSIGLPAMDGQPAKVGRAQLHVLRHPAVWVLGFASASMYVTRYALNSWGVLYLQEAKGFSLREAGALIGLGTFASIAGSISFGFVSDLFFRARRPPANLIFAILELGFLCLFFFAPPGRTDLMAVAIVGYGFGIAGLLVSLGGLFAVDISPPGTAGAAMGFIGIFSYLGAAFQEHISGNLIEKGTTVVDGVRHYDFGPAVSFWIGASVVSMLVALTLWRSRTDIRGT